MRFLSVCSGIEAASVAWNPLGWKAHAFSEIEPFPCAVLAHHYPDTPNWGDMTQYKEWPDVSIDLLCGGTPCQSFSVAGLRKGLDDPRGDLMLTYGAIAAKYKPKWIMWENVPGVVSSNGGQDFTSFLDMLEELGYICDIEILDAQYFGVAQRRRRVFVCGQHRDDLLSQKTDSSALTITQCLQEILQAILTEGCSKLGNAPGSSALPMHSRDGATRRMRLFGLDGESECWPMLRENLIAAFQRYQQEQKQSAAPLGEPEKEPMPGGQLTALSAESLFTLTEQSLKSALDEAFEVMRLFTTLTPTSPITQAQIYTCSRAALLIAKLTLLLNQSSPAFWNSALSSLTVIEEYTNYARSTNSDLFGDVERVQAWSDFIEQAEHTNDALLDIGIECAGEIFPLPACLQGHPAPSRKAGKAAPTIPSRSTAGGGLGTDFDCDGGLQVAGTMKACKDSGGWSNSADHAAAGYMVPVGTICVATGQAGAEIGADMAPTLNCNHEAPYVAHSLRGEGFDASEDGTGRGTPWVPVAMINMQGSKGNAVAQADGPSFTLNAMHGHDMHAVAVPVGVTIHGTDPTVQKVASYDELAQCLRARTPGNIDNSSTTVVQQPVAFAENSRHEPRLEGGDGQRTGALSTGGGKPGQGVPMIAFPANLSGTQCASTEELAPSMGALNPTAIAIQGTLLNRSDTAGPAGSGINENGISFTQTKTDVHAVAYGMAVRRLTPTECERLQGFPDDYTQVPHRNKPAADGPRYKALGNSWAVPVAHWIGRRIEAVEAIHAQQAREAA